MVPKARRAASSMRTRVAAGVALLLAAMAVLRIADAAPPAKPAAPHPAPAPRGYARNVQSWHSAPAGKSPPRSDAGRALLSLRGLNTAEYVELSPLGEQGAFTDLDMDKLAHFAREPQSGLTHPLHPRLADLLYRIQTHFVAVELRMLSGYRSPKAGKQSNHARGRAMDLVVPGHGDEEVARFVREQGFVGVGIYPTSGFVHIDVRDKSYFWIDASGPGRRNRERGVLHDVAQRADSRAIGRGEKPVEAYAVDLDVTHASSRFDASAPDTDEDDMTEADGT
jgi:uncharacterized protein YcbK (DUF882 family)